MSIVATEVVTEKTRRGWYANLVDAIRDLTNALHIDSARRFVQLAIDWTDAGTARQKAEILFHLANIELRSGAIEKGLRCIEEGLQIDSSSDFIRINAVIAYMNFCYFDRATELARSLVDSKEYGDRVWQALFYLQSVSFCDDRAARRRMEAGYADYLSRSGLVASAARPLAPIDGRKIRVGYVYSRWNYPPSQLLLKKLIESHDRDRFCLLYTSRCV